MKFSDLSDEDLKNNFIDQNLHKKIQRMNRYFYLIKPDNNDKTIALENSYKKEYAEYQYQLRTEPELQNLMKLKLAMNGFFGLDTVTFKTAGFKLHISLNTISDLDALVVQGLINLLIMESESPDNQVSLDFKFIHPVICTHKRFSKTDQFTLYFNDFSSVSDLLTLSGKIEQYLLSHNVPENEIKLGPKDHIGFNSFVSARFDRIDLLGLYNEYKFFDLELAKFFKSHSVIPPEIPVFAIEAVFNAVMFSDQITNIRANESGLSDKESQFVQAQLELMVADPKLYLTTQSLSQINKIQAQRTVLVEENSALFIKQLNKIEQKINQLRNTGYFSEARSAKRLLDELNTAFTLYKNSAKTWHDYQKFNSQCTNAISNAKPDLKNHRGWKEVFFNLAIGIATLGTAFLVNYACTNRTNFFFRVNTDSINQLNSINTTIEKMELKNLPSIN